MRRRLVHTLVMLLALTGAAVVTSSADADPLSPGEGNWTTVASPTGINSYSTAAEMPDGRLVIVGGYSPADAWIVDPEAGSSTKLPSLAAGRPSPGVVALPDGRIAVFGGMTGYSGFSGASGAEIYDPGSNSWSPLTAPSSNRRTAAIALPDGRILVSAVNGSYVWDPSTLQTTPVDGAAEGNEMMLATDGDVYSAGKDHAVYRFDVPTLRWSVIATPGIRLYGEVWGAGESSGEYSRPAVFQVDATHLLAIVVKGRTTWQYGRVQSVLIDITDDSSQVIDVFPEVREEDSNTQISTVGQLPDGTIVLMRMGTGYGLMRAYRPATQTWATLPNYSPMSGWSWALSTPTSLYALGNSSSGNAALVAFRPGAFVTSLPDAPRIQPLASGNSGSVQFYWNALTPPADGNSPVTGYVVTRHSADGDQVTRLDGGQNTYFQEQLGVGVGDTYTVQAVNAIGTGPASAPYTGIIANAPGAVQNFAISGSDGKVRLAWNPPASDGGSPITDYSVLRLDKYDGTSIYPFGGTVVTGTTFQDTSVTVGSTYTYYVFARNEAGFDPLSSYTGEYVNLDVTVTGPGVNNPPVASNSSFHVPQNGSLGTRLWAADPDWDTVTYAVATGPTRGRLTGTAPHLTYTPTLGFVGTDSFTWTASDGHGGTTTATVTLTVDPLKTTPGAPSAILPQPSNEDGDIRFSWMAPASNGNAPITSYKVIRRAGDGDHVTSISADTGGTCSFGPCYTFTEQPDVGVGDTYTVKAVNSVGAGPASPAWVGATGDAPGAVGNLTATGNRKVVLSWDPPTSNGGTPIAGYNVIRVDKFTSTPPSPYGGTFVTGTTFTDSTVQVGRTYRYVVVAANQAGFDALAAGRSEVVGEDEIEVAVIAGTNTPPIASNSARSVPENGVGGLVLSATDADDDPLTYAVTSGPAHGTLAGTAPYLVYTPAQDYVGSDSVTWSVSDGNGGTATATSTITVSASGANGVSQTAAPGDTVSTGQSVSPDDPTQAAVTPPVSGNVSIQSDPSIPDPSGYWVVGSQYLITAPQASVAYPLKLTFSISASSLPVGESADTVTVFRDGVPTADCTTSDGTATPDPCVSKRTQQGDTITLEVLSSHASQWTVGVPTAPTTTTLTAPGAITYGAPLTLSAEVTSPGPRPTGSVVFTDNSTSPSTVLGSAPIDSSGQAKLVLTTLHADLHTIVASYGGSSKMSGSSSMPATIGVTPAPAVVTPYPQTIAYGQADPVFAHAVTGLVNGDALTTAPSCSVDGAHAKVGTYMIACRGAVASDDYLLSQTSTAPLTVTLNVSTAGMPAGLVGTTYSGKLTATGGTGTLRYAVVGGGLPAGLILASGGTVSGTPKAQGVFVAQVRVSDSALPTAHSVTVPVSITIGPLAITTETLPGGRVGSSYSATVKAVGGKAPNVFSVHSGTLPTGLTMSTSGAISGTPKTAGTWTFTVAVKDSTLPTANVATRVESIEIAPMTVSATSIPEGRVGNYYSGKVSAVGGKPTVTFTLASGELPPGMRLATTGALTGTPTRSGTYTVTVMAKDATAPTANTATATVSIVVAPMRITTTALPAGAVNKYYSGMIAANGGVGTRTFTLASGALPPGLKLAVGGSITGTPTLAGQYTFTARVTDSANPANVATASLTITVS